MPIPVCYFSNANEYHDSNTIWQSESGHAYLSMESSQSHRYHPQFNNQRSLTWAQRHHAKIKNYFVNDWNRHFTNLTQHKVHPRQWHPDYRKELFFLFELYKHEGYIKFLAQFPEYAQRIIDIHIRKCGDPALQKKLENYYVKPPFAGLIGGTTVADFIYEKLSWARRTAKKQRIQREWEEEQEKKRQRSIAQEKKRKKEIQRQQEKVRQQQPVKDFFVEHIDEVHEYQQNLAYGGQRTVCDTLQEDRLQKRLDAIQTAIDERFRVSYKRYALSGQTSILLKQHNIDCVLFEECTGNAIQQQIHAELVSVLNCGSKLPVNNEEQETWLWRLCDFAGVGEECNKSGAFVLAHQLSDVCTSIFNCMKMAGDYALAAADCGLAVGEGVVNGFDNVATFVAQIIMHPCDSAWQAWKSIKPIIQTVWKEAALIEMARLSLGQSSEFRKELLGQGIQESKELHQAIDHAISELWKLPLREKCKLGTTMVVEAYLTGKILGVVKKIPGAVKVQAIRLVRALKKGENFAAVAEGVEVSVVTGGIAVEGVELAEAGTMEVMEAEKAVEAGAKTAKVIHNTGNAGNIIAAEGEVTPAMVRNAQLTEQQNFIKETLKHGKVCPETGLIKPDSIKIYSPKIVAPGANEGAIAELARQAKNGTQVAESFLQAVNEGKPVVKYGKSLIDKTTFLGTTAEEVQQLRNIFWEVMGGEETLVKLGLEGAIIDESFIAHFTCPEIRTVLKRSGKTIEKLKGFHVFNEELVQNGIIRIEKAAGGLFDVYWSGGVEPGKTFFPFDWTKERAVREVAKSIKEFAANFERETIEKIVAIDMTTPSGIDVTINIAENKRFLTCYPTLPGK